MNANEGYIYIIHGGQVLGKKGHIKIGMTKNESKEALLTRYRTYYYDCSADIFHTFDRLKCERLSKLALNSYRLPKSEIYELDYKHALQTITEILMCDKCFYYENAAKKYYDDYRRI